MTAWGRSAVGQPGVKETVIVIGWNPSIWHFLRALDESVTPGSKIVSYSQVMFNAEQLMAKIIRVHEEFVSM